MAEQTEMGDFGVPVETERRIRNAERHKLAHLLENDGAAMSSEPTDLIREADAVLDGITPAPWKADRPHHLGSDIASTDDSIVDYVAVDVENRADALFIAAAPDLVRRLRDALEAERYAAKQARDLCEHHHVGIATYADGLMAELGEAKAALAEANAAIERVKALADEWTRDGSDPRYFIKRIAGVALLRAIEGRS